MKVRDMRILLRVSYLKQHCWGSEGEKKINYTASFSFIKRVWLAFHLSVCTSIDSLARIFAQSLLFVPSIRHNYLSYNNHQTTAEAADAGLIIRRNNYVIIIIIISSENRNV